MASTVFTALDNDLYAYDFF